MNALELSDIFTNIYKTNTWGSSESHSGLGSTVQYTEKIRTELISIIKHFNIKNMIDTSCGDWNWMKLIQNQLPHYIGIDIVTEIIEQNQNNYSNDKTLFVNNHCLDYMSKLDDKSVDLIFCRHTLEHLPEEYNIAFLKQCNRVSKYLLVTNHELVIGNTSLNYPKTYRPINIRLEPYSFIMPNLIGRIYDGPNQFLTEMFMLFFEFTQNNGLNT